MKKRKVFLMTAVIAVLVLGLASVSFAATDWKSPAELLAGLTGKSVEEVQQARSEGTPYGAQAADADKLDAFREQRLEMVKDRLDQAVEDGQLTREEADDKLAAIEERSATCDGTGENQGEGGLQLGRMGNGSGARGNGNRGTMGNRGTGQAGANCPIG
ncbi:MAG: hypothetical protein SCM11_19115 [Bacillota bacterium]|nr:hypothetical protein [Bacillota bacterium]